MGQALQYLDTACGSMCKLASYPCIVPSHLEKEVCDGGAEYPANPLELDEWTSNPVSGTLANPDLASLVLNLPQSAVAMRVPECRNSLQH